RIGRVSHVEIDMVHAEPREARVDLVEDVAAGESTVVGPRTDGIEDLGAENDVLAHLGAARREPLSDPAFAPPAAVRVRGVEEVDPHLPRGVHDAKGVIAIFALPEEGRRAPDAAEVAAAEGYRGNLETGLAEPAI